MYGTYLFRGPRPCRAQPGPGLLREAGWGEGEHADDGWVRVWGGWVRVWVWVWGRGREWVWVRFTAGAEKWSADALCRCARVSGRGTLGGESNVEPLVSSEQDGCHAQHGACCEQRVVNCSCSVVSHGRVEEYHPGVPRRLHHVEVRSARVRGGNCTGVNAFRCGG